MIYTTTEPSHRDLLMERFERAHAELASFEEGKKVDGQIPDLSDDDRETHRHLYGQARKAGSNLGRHNDYLLSCAPTE